ncbi:basement membrane-specific heparan sulfate proteoglycan core protein isoform X3 [Ambystoma mexicanum]|uniref:basement membrane-specific heparan sulfate proteoglycan core protein isoform X3 n=1 Tax=Ambystoma mexicanum TaxID=8296 RepID=UPI0037E85B7E
MGLRRVQERLHGPLLCCLLLLSTLLRVTQASKVLDEVSFPDDADSDSHAAKPRWRDFSDDEDLLADEASGDDNGSAEIGSGTPLPDTQTTAAPPATKLMSTGFLVPWVQPHLASMSVLEPEDEQHLIYYRALVNFTNSIDFSLDLDNASSEEFREVSEAVVDTLESEYFKIPGEQIVSVVFIKDIEGDMFVELDVGSEGNANDEQIREVLFSVIESGSIASYFTSTEGFQFRRLGAVDPVVRECTSSEFTCLSGECVPSEYRCDRRPDCRDHSDEYGCEEVGRCSGDEFTCSSGECIPLDHRCNRRQDCRDNSDEDGCVFPTTPKIRTLPPVIPTRPPYVPTTTFAPATTTRRVPATTPARRTTPKPTPDLGPRPCHREEARCPNGQCIPRDYLCDGERDCKDGSDELYCGTPSPCEPNEFKCQNGRCALKLWRCDGDDDCGDRSDETNCPTKGPRDTCAPDQFICVSSRGCIPASYQCDDEADCPDRSDEVGCRPPTVITPPEETISASRGETVRFTCVAVGVPTPIITWRLNWGHIPTTSRVSMASENGHGTLVIRDVKEADQGAYTCEAINTKGMVFGIPDGVLVLKPNRGPCAEGQFHIQVSSKCVPCFCFGVTRACQNTGRYRNQIRLRFDVPDDFKGTNVSVPSHVGAPLLSSNQLLIDPNLEEFQLVDLSRRFLSHDSFWTLPAQFLGNKVDSYGGSLSFKVQYVLTRGQSEPVQKPDVVITGNGRKLVYLVQGPTQPAIVNQRRVHFTEENWRHESGAPVTREDLLMTLQNLDSIAIQTVYDNKMASVGLSDVIMDTTTVEFTRLGVAHGVEECRCPAGYSGLSCEMCAPQFDRVPGGHFLGTCSGCNCNGHASSCDSVSGYCLNCQHNTEGPQCNQCKAGFFGDPSRGTSDACRPCACPYIDARRRFSDTCFLDSDGQATCDACVAGYTGRRCEKCAAGYEGDPMQPGGKCNDVSLRKCDERGSSSTTSQACTCKQNVEGTLCDVCKNGAFFLSERNPDGCLKCFCMGVSKQCASSFWNRDQVRAAYDSSESSLFTLANIANTRTVSEGIGVRGQSELTFGAFAAIPRDTYFWVLPERFKGDKVTSYGGELRYTITYDSSPGSRSLYSKPDVILQGNGIFLEHVSTSVATPDTATTITVPFREHAWRRSDGQTATREHLLMALADIDLFMIRATYSDRMLESRISNIHMDVAVPHSTGLERAVEVENCQCPRGYTGPSCQDCDVGYTRSTSGLYLGTCEKCDCSGHATDCDIETGECQNCQHHTEGPKCDRCKPGYYGDPRRGSQGDCQPCPCPSIAPSSQTCSLGSDGRPTCDSCPPGYTGRQCERCAPGYVGDPSRGQVCKESSSSDCRCNPHGSISSQCDARGHCQCKPNVEGTTCGSCRPQFFHLSGENQEGCLPCFCMGVTQLCTSSSYHRDLVTSPFLPGNFQEFALVNRQHSTRITTGFTVEMSSIGPQLSFDQFGQLGQESYYWQLPDGFQGDKREKYFARMRRAHKNETSVTEDQLRRDVAAGKVRESHETSGRSKRAVKTGEDQKRIDREIWDLLSSFAAESGMPPSSSASPVMSKNTSQAHRRSTLIEHPEPIAVHSPIPQPLPAGPPLPISSSRRFSIPSSLDAAPGYSPKLSQSDPQAQRENPPQFHDSSNVLYSSPRDPRVSSSRKYSLVYKGFSLLPENVFYWQLPKPFLGDKVGSYGGRLRYTLSYDAGIRGAPLPDADLQITGNDIMLVAYQQELRPRDPKNFEIIFREQYWKRPDGQQATREHLMMVLADLDEILIRATYSSDMISASITGVSMEVAVPSHTSLPRAVEVEECRCPPGYSGLSCQDCAVGFTRTGGGLYLGNCELCECNGHSETCHPETGACSNCLHNTVGEFCDQCAPGYYGDATAGTPEDCQPCACPLTDSENQFSRTCESLGAEGYRCTACQPGYTGQYCERCAAGYSGNPNIRGQKCVAADRAPLVVQIHPARASVSQGGEVSLRCHVNGNPPFYFYWSREDGRPVPSNAQPRAKGEELHFRRVQPSDAGVYICTCRNLQNANTSRAEVIVAGAPIKPITVTVEEQKVQNIRVGLDVTFICTAKSQSPAYTLAWTRQNNDQLPDRAMDFNGILTIRNVQPSDAGVYICTGSNMFDMDEGTATLYVQASAAVPPTAVIEPLQLSVQQGQAAEFRCTVTGNPTPSVEWTGGQTGTITSKAIIQGGTLRFPTVEPSDEGHYTCHVRNSAGQHLARAILRVHSSSIPDVQVSPERIEVQEGDAVSLYCRAGGSPPATISWKKQGGALPSQALSSFGFLHFRNGSLEALHRRIQEIQSRTERRDISTLVIPSATAADGGTYICVGTSSSGSAEAKIEVIINRASAVESPVRIEPSANAVAEGQTVELNCLVAGPAPHTVTWHRPGGSLSANHQVSGSRMRIIKASLADSGEYICRVISTSGVQQASIFVSITPAAVPNYPSGITPTIRIEPLSNSAAEGQTVELNCVVAGQTQPTVTWYRPGRALTSNHQVSGSRLRILQASAADSGEYICRVSSSFGVQQASITVSIGSSPQNPSIPAPVRIESSSEILVEGQTVDLNCIVAGQKRSTVTWLRTGGNLSPNHQVSGSRLRIIHASPADSGEYVCRASSGSGFHQASITISILSNSQNTGITPLVRIESSHESFVEGQTVDLNCIVAGQHRPEVMWLRAGAALPSNHQVSGSRLRILQASPVDSGVYVCRTRSGSGFHEASITLSISSSSQNSGIVLPIRIESSQDTVVEGQTVELNCVVEGQHRPVVTWLRAGGALSPNHQVYGSRLRILQASPADSGEYICRVSSGAGSQQASVIVSITGPNQGSGVAPAVRIESSSESVVEGQTVELNCIVTGQAQPTITWHRAGGALSSNHQVSGSRLRILQASPADSGEYICRVSSGAGIQKASVMVSITAGSYRLQSPIISIDPHSATVGQGQDATFRCRIHDGAQPIRMEWKMTHNRPLQDNVEISPDGSIITIIRARHSNQGAYRCIAANVYGVAHSVVNLIVQGPPTVTANPKGPIQVKVGEAINIECMGIGDPRPVVSWRRTSARQNPKHQQALVPLDSNAVLQILSARPEDAGSYSCIAQNTYGSAQVQVEVHVEGRLVNPAAPSVTVEEALQIVVSGGTATLRCSAAGNPTPTITWSKLRAPLPWQHQVVNNTLIIPKVAQQDSGQYICNASSTAGFSEAFITLDVETPPYATSLPDDVSVRVGDLIQLQCLAHGTPPLRFQWSKVNATLSEKASVRDGVLHINLATAEDAGRYRCQVTNKVGTGEAFADVRIQAPLAVRVSPSIDIKGVGGTAEFTCAVAGDSRARIEWFKEGGHLLPGHSVRNGVLRIPNLDRGSEGVYTCRVANSFGQAQDSAKLVIQALPKVMINVRTSVQTVLVGNAVEFECLAFGDPKPSVTWSKVGSHIPSDVVLQGGMLKIEEVKQSDAGQYRCTATNDVGTVHSHVILHVQSVPQIAAQPEVKEITTGSTAVFPCMASGFPVPDITWTKLEGDLPKEATLDDNVLTIPSVKPEDAGTYVCTAANRQGRVTAFSMLKVRERVVPYFTNNPESYLTLPTIKDAYKRFEIQITFRPDAADGMLVYNGQQKNTGGDFISFGLVGGRPELRFDAGSGMATIRYPTPLKLGEFHTVILYRNLTQGALAVDNQPPVNGTSQGKFQGLDLNEKLYLGGYPDYEAVAKTGHRSGFVGCIRQMIIQGQEVIFKDLDLSSHGISNCPTCRDRPCQNRGVCRDSESSSYVCVCPRGFTGSNCEHSQALHCHPEACGPDATCINREDGQGYNCRCHLGKSGDKCMTGVMVSTPSFSGEDSFISYPPLTNIQYDLRVDMEFKPLSPNGLLFYSGGKPAPVEDFISLAMVNGHLEFRYELGSGQAILRSAEPLILGHWHKITAERMNKDGALHVDTNKLVKRSSPGKSEGLNLYTSMYLGGVDQSITVPAAANISDRFQGCIGEVSVNGKKVDISYSFLNSHGISQCFNRSPCDRMPCLHGGRCTPAGEYEFQCLCLDGYKGDRCETKVDQCLPGGHCSNGGTCQDRRCLCPPGFSGIHCEQGTVAAVNTDAEWHEEGSGGNDAPGQYGSYFSDDAYIALPRQMFPRSQPEAPEAIELEVRTTSSSGVILWQGVVTDEVFPDELDTNEEENEHGKGKDFVSLGLKDGHLVFSYQLGSGEANIMSEDPVNDGEWHRVTAIREGKEGSIQIDGEDLASGQSPGKNLMLNTKGSIYLGGMPNMKTLTNGKYSAGITGCIKNVVLMNARPGQQPHQPIDLQHHAEAGQNTKECPS